MVSWDSIFDNSAQVENTSTVGNSDDNCIVEIFEYCVIYPASDDTGGHSDSDEASAGGLQIIIRNDHLEDVTYHTGLHRSLEVQVLLIDTLLGRLECWLS